MYRLTNRDFKILQYLKEQGVATADQLSDQFFPNNSAFYKRVHKLKKAGCIESLSINDNLKLVPSKFRDLGRLLKVSPNSRFKMAVYRLGPIYKGAQDVSETISSPIYWQHQLWLNDVRRFLESLMPSSGIFLADPEIRREWARYKTGKDEPIPDLVWRRDGKSIAFELERTNKGLVKYFSRFSFYSRSNYDKIVYISANDKITDTLLNASRGFPNIGIAEESNLSKVFCNFGGFTTINEFLGV